MSSAALVARARVYSAEFGHCLANHLPMCLVILERLGASRTRQEAWFETYAAANGLGLAPEDGGRGDGHKRAGPPGPARAGRRLSRLLPAGGAARWRGRRAPTVPAGAGARDRRERPARAD